MKLIIRKAKTKFNKLAKNYDGFVNVVVDDWRGWRFIFDTDDVRSCDNNCADCPLFKLVEKEKPGIFSAGLYRASSADKKFFGSQNFLNCKTLAQYGQGYINFIKKIRSKKELVEELKLVSNLKIIYSRDYRASVLEKKYKNFIFNQAAKQAGGWKRKIIKSYSHEI